MTIYLRRIFDVCGRFMGRVWITAFYFTLALPFGLVARLRVSRGMSHGPAWSARDETVADVESARRQA
jgi:hypothetical protein